MLRSSPLRRGKRLRSRKDPLRAYLAVLLRNVVLHRDGYRCRKCGKSQQQGAVLQCAHIYSQGKHPAMRHHAENALCLCSGCHLYWAHKEPLEFALWLSTALPTETRARLQGLSQGGAKSDPGLMRIVLEQEAKRLGAPLPEPPTIIPIPKAKRRAE